MCVCNYGFYCLSACGRGLFSVLLSLNYDYLAGTLLDN